ncbi:MAG: hypothetical protein JXR76_17130 [Deltaproteobacteria bacterium]|nr:hypothetical protein [Deltaproteobacteria bacterium]
MRLRIVSVLTALALALCGCELVTEDFKKVKNIDTCSDVGCGEDTASTVEDTATTGSSDSSTLYDSATASDTALFDTTDSTNVDTATKDSANTADSDTTDTTTVDTADTVTVDTDDTATVDTDDTATIDITDTSDTADSDTEDSDTEDSDTEDSDTLDSDTLDSETADTTIVDTSDTADTADSDTTDSEPDTDALCAAAQCGSNAICVIEIDAAHCECSVGYQMDGIVCADINECNASNGGCGQNCVNTPGSYYCQCDEHYILAEDGYSCLPVCNDFHAGVTGAIGGAISDIAVEGDIVYALAGGNGVYVFDGFDGAPVLIGKSDVLHDGRRLLIDGDILLVADGEFGLAILDISEPSSPVVISQTSTQGKAIDVAVAGSFAYVLNEGGWVAGIDIIPPNSPKLLDLSHLGLGDDYQNATSLVAYGDKLVVSDAYNRMALLSTGVGGGVWTSSTFSNKGALDLHVFGERLYAAANSNGVLIFDLTAPGDSPVAISNTGTARSIWGNDTVLVAYSSYNPNAVTAFDVTDLEAITEIASLPWDNTVAAITGDSSNVYMADGTYGLQMIATDSLATVPLVAEYPMPGNSTQLAVKGNYAFVVDGAGGVKTVDLENPYAAAIVVPQSEGANAIAISGDYLYVAKNNGTIAVDVSDPVHAMVVAANTNAGSKIAAQGDYVYLGWGQPKTPGGIMVLKRESNTLTYVSQMSISNLGSIKSQDANRLYYATMTGFVALDISDPTSISTIDTVVLDGEFPAGFVLTGQYAFVGRTANRNSFISVISLDDMNEITAIRVGDLDNVLYADANHLVYSDASGSGLKAVYARYISNPQNPGPAMMLSSGKDNVLTTTKAADFAVWNNTGYVAKGAEGFRTLDFPWKYHPSIVSWQPANKYVNDVIAGNDMLYVADADGLQILKPELDGTLSAAAFWGSATALEKIWLHGTTLYATSAANDLRIYDVSNPAVESIPSVFDQDTRYVGIAGRNDTLYLAAQNSGLYTLDISVPLAPVLTGSAVMDGTSSGKDIALNGTTAYILDNGYSSRGLHLFDIANPAAPELLASSDTPIVATAVHQVIAVNNIVYVASGVAGITIFRQNGTSMVPLGVLDGLGDVQDFVAFDGKMAVASRSGLYVLDLTVPESPDVLCHIPVSTTLVTVDDNYLYAARQSDGISVIELFSCQEMQ